MVEQVARAVADELEGRRRASAGEGTRVGYLAPKAAGHYMGVPVKRIYDLKSMGALEPDGYDGRTPLYSHETLDSYVLGRRSLSS